MIKYLYIGLHENQHKKNNIWVGTTNHGVNIYANGKFEKAIFAEETGDDLIS